MTTPISHKPRVYSEDDFVIMGSGPEGLSAINATRLGLDLAKAAQTPSGITSDKIKQICQHHVFLPYNERFTREKINEILTKTKNAFYADKPVTTIFDDQIREKMREYLFGQSTEAEHPYLLKLIQIEEWEKEPGRTKEIEGAFNQLTKFPSSLDLMLQIVQRKGKPICSAERRLIAHLKRDLPDLNKALLSYELLQRQTDRLNLSQFPQEVMQIQGKWYRMYDLQGSEFRFIVHSAGPYEGTIEDVKNKRIRSGFLCTSLISNKCSVFYDELASYAMVLSVDPRNIVATTREDAFTPYSSKHPETQRFYCFYQRLQLLTGTIEKLWRGMGNQPFYDALSHLNRIKSLMKTESADPEIKSSEGTLIKKIHHDNQALFDFYKEKGLSLFKVAELNDPCKNLKTLSPEQGVLLPQIAACQKALEEIQRSHAEFHEHIHPIQGVEELLAQTPFQSPHCWNLFGTNPYNEINLDLSTQYKKGKDPIAVRAILINRQALEKNPTMFSSILADAKKNGIPILLISRIEKTVETGAKTYLSGNPALSTWIKQLHQLVK